MIGLIYKDFLVLKGNLRSILIVMAFWLIFAATSDMVEFIMLLILILLMNNFSWDMRSKWDAYGITLPLKKSDTVKAKYLCMVVGLGASAALSLALKIIMNLVKNKPAISDEDIEVIVGILFACLLMWCILLPLIYRFGVDKARIVLAVIWMIGTAIGVFVDKTTGIVSTNLQQILAFADKYMLVILVGSAIVIGAVSYMLSVKLYSRNEY